MPIISHTGLAIVVSAMGAAAGEVVLFSNTNIGGTAGEMGASNYIGGLVTTTSAWTVNSVEFPLKQDDTPAGNLIAEIYAVDEARKPTGAALGSKTLAASVVTSSEGEMISFEFATPVSLSDATEYAFVIHGSTDTHVQQLSQVTDENPDRVSSSDGGSTWFVLTGWSCALIINGLA